MTNDQVYYSKGFDKTKSDTHSWRNVENSSKFVTSVLKPNFKVLDVGCGPGTITIDFARNYLNQGGSIIGVEPTKELIDLANETRAKTVPDLKNIEFTLGSIYKLPFEENTFDLVHAHQVVVHLQDPIAALAELKRVTKPGGYVCVKDGDIETSIISPPKYEILVDYYILTAKNAVSTDIRAGRNLRGKAIIAGYEAKNITTSVSNWLLADDSAAKQNWAKLFINRIANNKDEVMFRDDNEKDQAAKREVIEKWKEWQNDENGLLELLHFEIIYKKPINM
ncbi:hypothetical protein KGF56_001109 [Candida oxycetoniae]|uniref:Methyltransferase domain-containing protein n=1 Tax=Candida oxycetoniae TaxID=497107 RepID=A0AAI9WZG7_9ASCO|nr:uncharacterized protein KGF56_001109 [Candida oxycetoniae]KAI3405890.1 hypothetical protein KGF56_001109 [Candida oxycetoniae]